MDPTFKADLVQLAELVNKRSDKLYAWLRWLVLLAAGFFSLMAGQLTGKAFDPLQWLLLKLALSTNGAGILFGAIALYGEVAAARQLAIDHKERTARKVRGESDDLPLHVGGRPSWLSAQSEGLCYGALATSLLLWCGFVVVL